MEYLDNATDGTDGTNKTTGTNHADVTNGTDGTDGVDTGIIGGGGFINEDINIVGSECSGCNAGAGVGAMWMFFGLLPLIRRRR